MKILPLSQGKIIKLYKTMLLIRYAELELTKVYKLQKIRTPVHFGLGQEATAVGVCATLKKDDVVFSHHRCHNHYLAKGGCINRFFAELYGREEGCSKGRGGSVHLTDRSVGVIATSAILGQMVPVSVGAALSFKMDSSKNVSVGFFGDGALDEGVIYESLNYASLNKLPVIFVCENNLYSTETSLSFRKVEGTEYTDRAKIFGCKSFKADGNNVLEIYELSKEAVRLCRNGEGPVFLELKTYRWLEHVGPHYDHEFGRTYRSKEEVDEWKEKCPIKYLSKYLTENQILDSNKQFELHKFYQNMVQQSINLAENATWPNPDKILQNVN